MSEAPDSQNDQQTDSRSPSDRKKKSNGSSAESRRGVHLVLQGKGGVGKSFVASLIAQHLKEAGEPVVCFDTDPVQSTLAGIPGLAAEAVELLDGDRVNVPAVDACLQRVLTEDVNFVFDNGAASFVPLSSYLLRDGIVDLIHEYGKRPIVHSVIVGGAALHDTAGAALDLVSQFPACAKFVLWLNPFFGDMNGFEDAPIYQELSSKVAGVVRLPKLDPTYGGAILRDMLNARKTFAEARDGFDFTLIGKLRLANIWLPIREQIAAVC